LALPANTFVDPQGEALSYSAYQVGGSSVVSWLSFNPQTETFSGAVPSRASGVVTLEVVARDTGGLTGVDMFNVTFSQPSVGHETFSIALIGVGHSSPGQATELIPL
jgi:hypothetical protein